MTDEEFFAFARRLIDLTDDSGGGALAPAAPAWFADRCDDVEEES